MEEISGKADKRTLGLVVITPIYFLKFETKFPRKIGKGQDLKLENNDLWTLIRKFPLKNLFSLKRKKEFPNLLCFSWKIDYDSEDKKSNRNQDHLMSERYFVAHYQDMLERIVEFSMKSGAIVNKTQAKKSRKPVQQTGTYTAENI